MRSSMLLLLIITAAFSVDHTDGLRVTKGIDSSGVSTQNIWLDQLSGANWLVGNDGNALMPIRYLFGSGINVSSADGNGCRTISVSGGSVAWGDVTGKPSFATVATSGAYNDLTGKPPLATVATTGNYSDLIGKPALARAYEGSTNRGTPTVIAVQGTVSGGTAVFHLTTDGTSGGTAIFGTGPIKSAFQPVVNDSANLYPMSWAWSNSDKTVTVTVNRSTPTGVIALLGINILGAPTTAANGTTIQATVFGY